MCEWCYQDPMKDRTEKTEEEEDDTDAQVKDEADKAYHSHR